MSQLCSEIFLITGASRGLGRAIATAFAAKYHPLETSFRTNNAQRQQTKARFLLVARSTRDLEKTTKDILEAAENSHAPQHFSTTSEDVLCRPMDLSDLDQLNSNIDTLLNDLNHLRLLDEKNDDFSDVHQHLMFVNNAASLGHLGPSWEAPTLQDFRETIDFNITSSLWLSVRFSKYIRSIQQTDPKSSTESKQKMQDNPLGRIESRGTIVNISSLVAVSDDFDGMGIYSMGKAARDKYHTLMAREDPHRINRLRILNYAPGPLETSMTKNIRESSGLDSSLKSEFEKPLLDPRDSARRLVKLLASNNFENGAHIDYYDLDSLDGD